MPKKRKTARESELFAKRSAAAKKGHETRRKRALPKNTAKAQKLVNNARAALGKATLKRPSNKRRKDESKDDYIERLERENAMMQSDLVALQETAHFTHVKKPEYLHKDGSVALMPSRLRHMKEASQLRKLLKKRGDPEDPAFIELAGEIADYYEVELQEVYTLFWSP